MFENNNLNSYSIFDRLNDFEIIQTIESNPTITNVLKVIFKVNTLEIRLIQVIWQLVKFYPCKVDQLNVCIFN